MGIFDTEKTFDKYMIQNMIISYLEFNRPWLQWLEYSYSLHEDCEKYTEQEWVWFNENSRITHIYINWQHGKTRCVLYICKRGKLPEHLKQTYDLFTGFNYGSCNAYTLYKIIKDVTDGQYIGFNKKS